MDVTDSALRDYLRSTIARESWKSIREQGKLPLASYALGCSAILCEMGPEWSEKSAGNPDNACEYFKANRADHGEMLRFMSRVTDFGELIYNLQGVAGFEERIRLIKADDRNGVESGIAELIAGKFFKVVGVPFEFMVARGDNGKNLGKNADIDYVAGHNRVESCEVKCNLQTTDLNERSIINSLKAARRQLPKRKAGIILLRIPEEWIADMERGVAAIESAVLEFIRSEKTTRVSSIFILTSATRIHFAHEKMAQIFAIKEFRNEYCEQGPGICIPNLNNGAAPNWRSLQAFAAREIGLAQP